MDIITRLEEAILIAIWRLEENAYGVTINREVGASFHKKYTMGALYYSLDQLLRKRLVARRLQESPREQAGRRRTYYTLTKKGQQALREAREHQDQLWKGIPDMAFVEKKAE